MELKPGLSAAYTIRPGNGVGLFYKSQTHVGHMWENLLRRACENEASMRSINVAGTVTVSRVSSNITSLRLINCRQETMSASN